jgi:hypothetical protein
MTFHILNEEQEKEFLKRMEVLYEEWKNNHPWEGNRNSYKEGIVDFCDALIYVSGRITYDISHLRNEVEYLLDEIDNKEEKNEV